MDERLSDMVDAALRWHAQRERPSPKDIERCWPALAELLVQIGIFARDMERTDALHGFEPARQTVEREGAALRFYGRLVEPPHGDNVVSMPVVGIGRVLVQEATRS
jgi:hypothetical protein